MSVVSAHCDTLISCALEIFLLTYLLTKWRRNVAENFNRLSMAHERYRQTTDRQTDRRTDGRRHIANMNVRVSKVSVMVSVGVSVK